MLMYVYLKLLFFILFCFSKLEKFHLFKLYFRKVLNCALPIVCMCCQCTIVRRNAQHTRGTQRLLTYRGRGTTRGNSA